MSLFIHHIGFRDGRRNTQKSASPHTFQVAKNGTEQVHTCLAFHVFSFQVFSLLLYRIYGYKLSSAVSATSANDVKLMPEPRTNSISNSKSDDVYPNRRSTITTSEKYICLL